MFRPKLFTSSFRLYKAKKNRKTSNFCISLRNIWWQFKLPISESRIKKKKKTELGPNNFLLDITPVTTYVHKVYMPYKP